MRRLIRCDGTTQDFDTSIPNAGVRALIGAQTLDSVQLRHLGVPAHVMLLDDSGHAIGKPLNEEATRLYHANCKPGTGHVIVGDVFVSPDQDYA